MERLYRFPPPPESTQKSATAAAIDKSYDFIVEIIEVIRRFPDALAAVRKKLEEWHVQEPQPQLVR